MHHTLALLIGFFFTASVLASDKLSFAYSEGDHPLSYTLEATAAGLLPDLVDLVFNYIEDYEPTGDSLPWPRAQLYVEQGERDGFLTYPSDNRKRYALFSDVPVYVQDYGYMVYHKDNPKRELLKSSTSFQDLAGLTVVVEIGSDWEKENIPSFLNRVTTPHHDSSIHLLYLRKSVDFVVMPPWIARHIASRFGYQNMIEYTRAGFIKDALIPFHIGISKANKNAEAIVELVNKVLRRKDFQDQKQLLIDSYSAG